MLTDSDGAGLVIRNHIKSIAGGNVKHAYIPEIEGKERRKTSASKAGLLGVEGMRPEVIIEALRRAGATFSDEAERCGAGITKQDMYSMGLSGKDNSAEKRELIAKKLDLPRNLSANAFLAAVNMIFTREEFEKAADERVI